MSYEQANVIKTSQSSFQDHYSSYQQDNYFN
jgi:hypothetical protein